MLSKRKGLTSDGFAVEQGVCLSKQDPSGKVRSQTKASRLAWGELSISRRIGLFIFQTQHSDLQLLTMLHNPCKVPGFVGGVGGLGVVSVILLSSNFWRITRNYIPRC